MCLSVATIQVKMDSYLKLACCPTQRERIFLESRHWDRQDPITTTMFGGTVLHTHAQKTVRPCLGASNTCTKDAFVTEKASLRSRLSTYELCLGCTGGQIGTREPGCNGKSFVICLRSMITTQDCARVNGAPIQAYSRRVYNPTTVSSWRSSQ